MQMKKMAYPAVSLILVLACLLFSVSTLAWMAKAWRSGPNLPFVATVLEDPDFVMWTWADEWTDGEGTHTNGFREIHNQDEKMYKIRPVDMTGDGVYTVDITSLHLGTVDNVYETRDYNCVYLRYRLNVEKQGDTCARINFRFATHEDDTPSLRLYGKKSGQVLDADQFVRIEDSEDPLVTVNADLITLNATVPLLEYAFCISAEAKTPNDADFKDVLTFDREEGDLVISPVTFGTESRIDGPWAEPGVEDYYLYIRINPNLDAVGDAASIINLYMPAILLLDLTLDIEVY